MHYISYDAPIRAEQFGIFLLSKTKLLSSFPELGRVVPEFDDLSIREIIVQNYRVIYRVDHIRKIIEVIRYWRGARGEPEINS